MEMVHHKVSALEVTETHIPNSGKMVLDDSKGYTMVSSGRQDGSMRDRIGLALAPHAKGEFLTNASPLLVVVVYAPCTNQSSTEDKDLFYSDLKSVTTNANGLIIVMGDFNTAISDSVEGVVGPHGPNRRTNDNGERLVSFASSNYLTITNSLFPHKLTHQASRYPPNLRAQPSLKDYVLVRRWLRPSVLSTRAYRGADRH